MNYMRTGETPKKGRNKRKEITESWSQMLPTNIKSMDSKSSQVKCFPEQKSAFFWER